jgi:hypothetical protein
MNDQATIRRLEAQLRTLRRYTIVSTSVFGVLAITAFTTARGPTRFTEIEVERINVVEADGRYALVIANAARLPGGIIRGKEYPASLSGGREESSGIIFFNHEGTEAGGLTYGSKPTEGGNQAGGSFTFDRMNQDQVVQLSYQESRAGRTFSGMRVWDRPARHIEGLLDVALAKSNGQLSEEEFMQRVHAEIEGTAHRVVLGSSNRTALLQLSDTRGVPRIRLAVDSLDVARLEFLNTEGNVVLRLPEQQ